MTSIAIYPLATEKAYGLVTLHNTYVFSVPLTANKQQIVEAIETQFEVKVTNIKTLVQNGKAVRFSRGKRAQPGHTTRKDAKKAYVTLVAGDSIKIFDEVTPVEEEKK